MRRSHSLFTRYIRQLFTTLFLLAALTPMTASAKDKFKVAWSIYAGWMPWDYGDKSGIVKKWADKYGIDIDVVQIAAKLLYQGPWVSERYAAIEDFIRYHADAMHPVTRQIIESGALPSAVDAFRNQYRLQHLKQLADREMESVDAMLLPTAPDIYTVDEVLKNPLELNSRLGTYTNFMNLLDYAALAVPAGFTPAGLPFGVTLFSRAFSDDGLLRLAAMLHDVESSRTPQQGFMEIAVCGAHLSGLPLNHQLTKQGAYRIESTTTTADYRLYALQGGPPYRPGLVKAETGAAIEVEVWALPQQYFGSFMRGIPAPLGIGSVDLADGRQVKGFICEPWAIEHKTGRFLV